MTKFPALIGRHSGELEIFRDRLDFKFDDPSQEPVSIRAQGLRVTPGGQNSHHYFLVDPARPEISISVQDAKVLELLNSYGVKAAGDALAVSSGKTRLRVAAIGSPLMIALALILAGPLLLSFVPMSWLENALTVEEERKLGKILAPLVASDTKGADSKSRRAVERLALFIREKNPALAAIEFDFRVASSKEVNAFALPGAIVVMNSGLLAQAKSVEEVAGVLSHEMAHVERRHNMKALVGRLGSLFGFVVLSSMVGTDGALVIAKAGDLVSLRYSRTDETEADARGFEFLANAGIDAGGMIEFFDRGKLVSAGVAGAAVTLFSTHPLSDERVSRLKELARSRPAGAAKAVLPVTIADLQAD